MIVRALARFARTVRVNCCTTAVCGNGVLEVGEKCDSGDANGQAGKCNALCTNSVATSNAEFLCTDSDNGKTYGTFGGIIGQNVTNTGQIVPYAYADACTSWSNTGILEYYCDTGNKYGAIYYDCSTIGKTCIKGVCK